MKASDPLFNHEHMQAIFHGASRVDSNLLLLFAPLSAKVREDVNRKIQEQKPDTCRAAWVKYADR